MAVVSNSDGEWVAAIDRLVIIRNAAELRPVECSFNAHRHIQKQLFLSQQRVQELRDENARISERNRGLTQQVHALELSSAGAATSTGREDELEAKLQEAQRQLQENLTHEKDYYKAQCESRERAEENARLRDEVAQLTETATQRESVLRMMRNEYVALKQEVDVVRPKLNTLTAERDRCIRELIVAKDAMAKMQDRVLSCEDELNRLRKERAAAHADPQAADSRNQTNDNAQTRDNAHTRDNAQTRDNAPTSVLPPAALLRAVPAAHGDAALYAVCAADGGRRLVTGGGDRCVRHWDAYLSRALRSHTSAAVPLCLDSASHYLLAGCADGVARFWDTRTLRTAELTGHSEKIVAAYLSQSAHTAFTASSDHTIKLWDVRKSALARTIMCQSSCNDLCVADALILSAHYNGSLCIWDRRAAGAGSEVKRAHQQAATCVRLDPCSQRCVSLGRDGAISLRDVRKMECELLRVEHADLRISTNLSRLALSPDGKRCAVGNVAGDVLLASFAENGGGVNGRLSGGHQGAVLSVVWTCCESSQIIASIGEDKSIAVWK